MAMGPITWACLVLAAHAGTPDVWYMNQRGFQIPIRIQPERRPDIRELRLWVSRDLGQSWQMEATATPDKEFFPYFAPKDGPYWFSVSIVDTRGRSEPVDVSKAPVGQRIVVDTAKPDLHIVLAERQGDEIVVSWSVREEHPDSATLKLEYRFLEPPDRPWTPAPVLPGQSQTRFRPGGPGAVALRLSQKDMAGNEGLAQTTVGPLPNAGPASPPSGVGPLFSGGPGKTSPEGSLLSPPPPAPTPPPSAMAVGLTSPGLPPEPARSPERVESAFRPASPPPLPTTPAPAPLMGESTTAPAPTMASTQPATGAGPRSGELGALPPLRIINKRQVKIDFNVPKLGPSGLGGVDVFVTQDEGATWRPALAEISGLPMGGSRGGDPVHASITVPVPDEGIVYGFYLVVKSRAGLGKPPPRGGEPPQVRVESDTTQPVAELYSPQADPERPNTLVLSWKATDRNLTANPITLEWAERKEGPWKVIGDPEMPNTGRYTWQVPESMPPKVYLRLTVRDTAGNNAVAQTGEPVLIDVTVPEARDIQVNVTAR